MSEYLVIEPVMLTGGILTLNEDQAKARRHKLKALGNGQFEVMQSVTFKAGEIIGYDGVLSKTQASQLESAEPEKKPEADKKQPVKKGS